jgi:hypothetical protein
VDSPFGYWAKQQLGYADSEIYPEGIPFNGSNHLETKSSISHDSCEAAYHRYQTEVEAVVPPEKLVSYSIKQGWKPLCEHFLPPNAECPSDEPFPRANSRSDGFLLDYKRKLAVTVQLHKIHPILARREYLVRIIARVLKWQSGLSNIIVRGRNMFRTEL